MKATLTTIVFFIFAGFLFAQIPQAINYQAIARETNGTPITSGNLASVQFEILEGSSTGSQIFNETHQNVPLSPTGLFILKIGSINQAQFSAINWSTGAKYLKVTINGNITSTATEILSVPYALYANTTGSIQNSDDLNVYVVSKNPQITDHSAITVDSSLSWTLNKASVTSGIVILRGSHIYPILHDITVPENVTIKFYPSAIVDIANNALFDIKGFLDAPIDKIFSGNGSVFIKKSPFIRPHWFGAKGDGINDDTNPIRKAMETAAQMYNQVAFPPAGNYYDPPIVLFKPGSYRVTDEIPVYNGLTVSGEVANPFTVGHTRLIMDLSGNENAIFRPTRYFQGAKRTNNASFTIQDLEFWYVTIGGSITEPAGGAGYGNNSNGTPKHTGCAIKISEQCIDVRIKRCNFFQSPFASILLTNDENEPNSKYRSVHIDECEFDSGNRFIRGENVDLDLTINSCTFFSGSAQYDVYNCTGDIITNSCRFDWNPHIVIQESQLHSFHFVGNHHTNITPVPDINGGFITLDNAEIVNISSNTFDKVRETTIHVISCRGGVIANNAINNSGINTTNTTPNTNFGQDLVPAAIRLSGCKNVIVSGNAITTTDTGANFGGFGIYTRDYLANSQGNYIFGNLVSGNYNGANWNGQNRKVNVDAGDTKLNNL